MKKLLLTFCLTTTLAILSLIQDANATFIPTSGGAGSGLSGMENTYEVDPVATGDYGEATKTCTGAHHSHTHYNYSTDDSTHEYWGVVHEFAIVLDEDFLDSVDTQTNFLCTDGSGNYDPCNFDKDADLGEEIYTKPGGDWSGVSITYQTLDWIDGDPVGLVWEYGTSDPSDIDLKPWINSTDHNYHNESISFQLENYYTDQSATTESWTKMEYYYIDPHDDYSDLDNWEHVYTEDVDTDGDGDADETGVDPDGDYIYWYGLNGTEVTYFPACQVACADLEISPDTLNVSDVFSGNAGTDFTLTATGSDGSDITNDVQITYESFDYFGAPSTGDIMTGSSNNTNRNSGPIEVGDTDINYRRSQPGDMLTAYVSDYEGNSYEEDCSVYVEWPYCDDLDITNPSFAFISTGDVDTPIEYEAEANNGEVWPYSVTYTSTDSASTFDGDATPYTADPGANVASYQSSVAASVTVEAENDIANSCSDYFTYGTMPTCESLEIIIPTSETLTCEEMSEEIEIRWESLMSSGAPTTGPWLVTSSNTTTSEFSLTPGGPNIGVAGTAVVNVPPMVIYYRGEDGDAIQVMDMSYPACVDSIDSETCDEEAPVCDDLTLSEPYVEGTTTPLDLTDEADLATLYENSTVCWDFTLNATDASYAARLIANGFSDTFRTTASGNLSLTIDTVGSDTGNPASVAFTGLASYTGTICWENYEAGNELSMFVLGDRIACHAEEELPPPETPEVPVCVDLQMSPDSYTMSAEDVDAGNIPVIVSVQGSDATWTGTLIVEHTGTGALFYSDGSPSTAGDGHLEIPASGTAFSVTVFYRNGHAGDVVTSSIRSEAADCNDVFTITQPAPGQVCEDLELSPDSVTMEADDEDAGTINGKVVVSGSGSEWTGTLIITKDGEGILHYADGSNSTYSDGRLEIAVAGGSSTETFTYTGGQADDTVRAYIQNDSAVCSDEFSIEQPTPVCEEIDFPEEIETYNCQDVPGVELCIDRDEDDVREVEICYEQQNGEDGEWEYNGQTYEGCEEIIFNFEAGQTNLCADITFNEVCEGANIEVRENDQICEEIETNEVEVGSFEKFIYTFNFASEKNSYTDEGVFFSHDEDRAFYTLDYDPAGDEEAITFTDQMWGFDLEGHKGDGTDSGGSVRLATTYDELVNSKFNGAYDEYNLITNMGFGCESSAKCREEDSQTIANYVGSDAFKSNYTSFIAYIKYPSDFNRESVLIEECEYDEDDNLESEDVCYDPDHSPTTSNDVVIENTGTVQDDYGVEATIRIRYVGVIDSGLDCGDDADGCLTEEFENIASVEAFDAVTLTDSAKLVVLCSYLMTQNAGDVYLEVSLQGGSDISCIFVDEDEATSSDYRNVDSLIILEESDDATDEGSFINDYSTSTVSFCDDDEDNFIGNISSYVCEIVAKVSDLWAKTSVESTTDSHLSQATRNADTDQVASDSTYSTWPELAAALTNNNNPDSNILYFDASQSTDGKMTLGKLEVPAGAWTVIVEGGDLVLTGNIAYAATNNIGDYKNLPSVAFVVQDGDIYIDDSAGSLVGVYYTNQKFDGDERSAVDEQLTVEGSFYGNVQTLIERAKYVGPPTIDGGGIVIKYDSRIILNTPPALSDYVNISTEKGVN